VNNNICRCGHVETEHSYEDIIDGEICKVIDAFDYMPCDCTGFKIDNLKYLESLIR